MLASLFRKLVDFSPNMSVKLWRFFYEIAARYFRNMKEWKYMNYGFATPGENKSDNLNTLSENLYNHLFMQADLRDKAILEVGCGRGGGCELALNYQPKSVTGLDFSAQVIHFCKKFYLQPALHFVAGNAEDLPFEQESFDVVVNLESSHCYGNRIKFFEEVFDKLKPGGFFLYADFMGTEHLPKRPKQLADAGFNVGEIKDITPNVLEAMRLSTPFKEEIINKRVPKPFRKPIHDFAGLPGSDIFNNFSSGKITYFAIVCQKPV